MNLQKYRTHPIGPLPHELPWGATGERGCRVMSRHRLFQLWVAGVILGGVIVLALLDPLRPGGSWFWWNPVAPGLVGVSLMLAFNAVYLAPRPSREQGAAKEDDDSLSFR